MTKKQKKKDYNNAGMKFKCGICKRIFDNYEIYNAHKCSFNKKNL